MFWWGHEFSSTLQLAGRTRETALPKLLSVQQFFSAHQYFIGVNENPWQHHFELANYRSIAELTEEEYGELLYKQPHIKIAARWPLTQWDAAANHLFESWKKLAALVA